MKRLLLALAAIAPPALAQDVVGQQIAASAAAAQALQGPLDGEWVLSDRRGVTLLTLQIGDPPTRAALACAWRTPVGERGYADCSRGTRELTVRLTDGGVAHLIRQGAIRWRGTLIRAGHTQSVTLRRG